MNFVQEIGNNIWLSGNKKAKENSDQNMIVDVMEEQEQESYIYDLNLSETSNLNFQYFENIDSNYTNSDRTSTALETDNQSTIPDLSEIGTENEL